MIQIEVQKLPYPKVFIPYRLIVDVLDERTHEALQRTLNAAPETNETFALVKAMMRSQGEV